MREFPEKPRYQAFAMVPVRSVLDSDLSHAEFRALCAVAVFRNSNTGWTHVSHATLASSLGLKSGDSGGERLRQLLAKSISKGYIDRVSGAGRTNSRYRLVLDQRPPTEAEVEDETDPSDSDGPHEYAGAAPMAAMEADPMAAMGCTRLKNHTRKEPEKSTHTPAELTGPGPASWKTDAPFQNFWVAYPRKEGPPNAWKAWIRAIRDTPPEAIMAGLQCYQFSSEKKFRPLPATWLNDRRWEAEQETPGAAAAPRSVAPDHRSKTGWMTAIDGGAGRIPGLFGALPPRDEPPGPTIEGELL